MDTGTLAAIVAVAEGFAAFAAIAIADVVVAIADVVVAIAADVGNAEGFRYVFVSLLMLRASDTTQLEPPSSCCCCG